MADTLTTFFKEQGIMPELIVFIISMLPILELRGGLIAAALLGISPYVAVPVCIIANLLPIPFVLLFIRKILDFLKRFKKIGKWITKLEEKTESKGEKIKKSEFAGLMLFVGIPLPGTGAWTGSLAAVLFGIKFKKAMLATVAGVFIATAIMLVFTYLIPGLFGFNF